MILPDVNILVYTHRSDSPNHDQFREWLEAVLLSDSTFGVVDLVLSGFVRIVTHPRVFKEPSPLPDALASPPIAPPQAFACVPALPSHRVTAAQGCVSGSHPAVQPPNRPLDRPRPRLTAESTESRTLDS